MLAFIRLAEVIDFPNAVTCLMIPTRTACSKARIITGIRSEFREIGTIVVQLFADHRPFASFLLIPARRVRCMIDVTIVRAVAVLVIHEVAELQRGKFFIDIERAVDDVFHLNVCHRSFESVCSAYARTFLHIPGFSDSCVMRMTCNGNRTIVASSAILITENIAHRHVAEYFAEIHFGISKHVTEPYICHNAFDSRYGNDIVALVLIPAAFVTVRSDRVIVQRNVAFVFVDMISVLIDVRFVFADVESSR